MFARTERLTLRPGWAEDAPDLVRAIAHESVVTKLSRAPWPYALGDALAFLSSPRPTDEPALLVLAHQPDAVRLIGVVGLHREEDGALALGYWLTPGAWGRGYATEASRALLANARDTLRVKRIVARHFVDNPGSGRVLRKLGFRPTGQVVPAYSRARDAHTPAALFELDLSQNDVPARAGDMMVA
jgi:RimJ/RimL family protein N-acetyltransferase